jgi:ribose transport system ATP-binding protein
MGNDRNPVIALQMRGISRSFPGVRALSDVDFTVLAGEVHALVGENGAGKSTLMAVAAGLLPPDSGTVRIGDADLRLGTPKSARELGLRIVRQHPALAPDLTVGENLALGVDPDQRLLRADVNDWARDTMSGWGMSIDPRKRVAEIPLPHQFVVEITRARLGSPTVLILDEPTEHLAAADVDLLYDLVEDLRAQGTGIVYISHRIREVQRFASRLTVLRDGQTGGTFDTATVTEPQIVTLVLGRSLTSTFPPKGNVGVEPVLEARSLSGRGFSDVDLDVRQGEILGLAGIEGSGQRGILSALAGTEPARGSLRVKGVPVRLNSIRSSRRLGVSYVPEDRHTAGLFLSVGVGDNVMAGVVSQHTRGGFIRRASMNAQAVRTVAEFDIKTPSLSTPIDSLSGGNQQKTLLARSALEQPQVLIADEPTQGVDAGARVQIYQALRSLCDSGSSVVVLSSDAVEMAGLCDRVLVLSRGHVVRELDGDSLTPEAITESALTSTVLRTGQERPRLRSLSGAQSWLPPVVVAVALLVLGLLAASHNDRYATSLNASNLLTLFAPLAFVAMGQLFALLLGGIDLSVGPLMGLTVVACSFMIPPSGGLVGLCMALLTAVAVGVAAGLVNGLLITKVEISPVIATLATYMAVLGIGQIARPLPAGIISNDYTNVVQSSFGPVPVAAIVAVVLAVGLDVALRRTGWGLRLRATGSDAAAAGSMGISVTRCRIGGYVLAASLAALAGLLLAAQTGIGDPAAGTTFTFASITAVILGGASIYGGRGSFIGAVLGAALVAQIDNVTTFLQLSSAWQYWLLAILTITAAGIYSRIGRVAS